MNAYILGTDVLGESVDAKPAPYSIPKKRMTKIVMSSLVGSLIVGAATSELIGPLGAPVGAALGSLIAIHFAEDGEPQ